MISEGKILLDGRNIFSMGAAYRGILGYLPQDYGFYPALSVYDYMMYIASIKGLRPAAAKKRSLQLPQPENASKGCKRIPSPEKRIL